MVGAGVGDFDHRERRVVAQTPVSGMIPEKPQPQAPSITAKPLQASQKNVAMGHAQTAQLRFSLTAGSLRRSCPPGS